MEYRFQEIEKKWQEFWEQHKTYKTKEEKGKESVYVLDMFPYPSGSGLHVGHPKGYVATDILSRMYMMQGKNVLHPMGFDAFGLPAENYAIKNKMHPRIAVQENIENFKQQLSSIGFSYDWDREINTTDPKYYKWTQWIFLQLYKQGLAYEAELPINWCPSCKTGLANEEVVNGKCERCGTEVTKKQLRQWVLKITAYAEQLLEGLDGLDWPESIKLMQKNWIGRSEGAEIYFEIEGSEKKIDVFTTRPDTVYGATYLVLSPEHAYALEVTTDEQKKAVETYIQQAQQKSDLERTQLQKEKTGVFTGRYVIHPLTQEKLPIWIADYVLGHYGHGAIMAVPCSDDRDYDFAVRYEIPMKHVVVPSSAKDITVSNVHLSIAPLANEAETEKEVFERWRRQEFEYIKEGKRCYTGEGIVVNSDLLNGLSSHEAKEKIIQILEEKQKGKKALEYKLRDWLFSRQRYWGEPIPVIHCEVCGIVPVPEDQLPVTLPDVENYEPTGTGESPLAAIEKWVNTTCPNCGGKAKRETNTMPQWAGSCWYYLRYIDPNNEEALASMEKMKEFLPVDMYVGGAEHAVLHLLYARFWHKVLYDLQIVPMKEPFHALRNVGLVLAEDGQKMSKSLGNVVNPDDVIRQYGADSFRLYEMFMGPFEQTVSWNTNGVSGVYRFLQRVIRVMTELPEKEASSSMQAHIEKTIQKVTDDITHMQYNTAISAMMIIFKEMEEFGSCSKENKKRLLQILAPFAPHISEELWEALGESPSIFHSSWPVADMSRVQEDTVTYVIMVNGKVRDNIIAQINLSQEEVQKLAQNLEKVKAHLEGKNIQKVVFVENKLINFVTNHF